MTGNSRITAIIEQEDDGFTSLCPELDIASQGDTREEAFDNLKEALEGFLMCASPQEVASRLARRSVRTMEFSYA